jgi:hypothetical protein
MKYVRTDEIECGEKNCASEPGKFCKYLGISKLGMQVECRLFGCVLDVTKWGMGWTQRCKECLEAFVAIKSPDKIDEYNSGIDSIKDGSVYNIVDYLMKAVNNRRPSLQIPLDVEDALGRGSNEPVLIPDHNNQEPPVFRKHMESVGLTVRNIAGFVYVFHKDGRVWRYDEIEWSYGATGQLMVNHTPIHAGTVPAYFNGVWEGK